MSKDLERNRAELLRRLPADMRIESANRHVDALRTMPLPEVKLPLLRRPTYDTMFWSFLEGWDAAMSARLPEMLDENRELHLRVMDNEIEEMRQEGFIPPIESRAAGANDE